LKRFLASKYLQNALSVGVLPRTPLGELTALPDRLVGLEGGEGKGKKGIENEGRERKGGNGIGGERKGRERREEYPKLKV